ncbi:class I SAM-dependent methyltransferase [Fulvimarina sp. MAC3]|uniref:class I SAM-dependent methyltransferase n=1 Tax=Fulvimarina sp. MAC3 TaxID=3148887 RepID=UPI0031FE1B59
MTLEEHPLPKVLNVGSGPPGADDRFTAQFVSGGNWQVVRADVDPNVAPDVVATATDLSALQSDSFDAVWCSHILEHLFAHETETAAREIFRVLKRGGTLFAFVPDVEAAARAVAAGGLTEPLYTSPAGPITPHDILYGHGASIAAGRTAMAHRSGFTPNRLGEDLHKAGFDPVVVQRTTHFEIQAKATKPLGDWSDDLRTYGETPGI